MNCQILTLLRPTSLLPWQKLFDRTKFFVRNFSSSEKTNMRFVQYTNKNKPEEIRLGYLEGECIVDIGSREHGMPHTMLEFLQNEYYYSRICELQWKRPCCMKSMCDVDLKAPITGMDKVICVCLNYKDHCEQHKLALPEAPMVFSKFSSTVIGPSDPLLIRTDVTSKVDWEVELCIVMGKKASFVTPCRAFEYIFGCTISNDISARDWQKEKNGGQFLLGKSMDTFCPIGPWIVTLDEFENIQNLDIKCSVNGVYKQKSNTNQLIFKIPDIIERLSSAMDEENDSEFIFIQRKGGTILVGDDGHQYYLKYRNVLETPPLRVMTLLPGDIILTGTPGGVGTYSNPPEYLKPGDLLRSEIEKIGVLETRIEKYIRPDYFPWQNNKVDKTCWY